MDKEGEMIFIMLELIKERRSLCFWREEGEGPILSV